LSRRAKIGQIISHYRVIEKLGGGVMGVVDKAEDLVLGRFVALSSALPQSQILEATSGYRASTPAISAPNQRTNS